MSLAAQQDVGDAVDAVNGTAHESVRSVRVDTVLPLWIEQDRLCIFFTFFLFKFGMRYAPLSSAQLIAIGVDTV